MVESRDTTRDIAARVDERLTVMIVDDDEDLLAMLGDLLRSEGYEVVRCRDAAGALAALQRGPQPDIIVLDLLMPGMNGWEFRLEQKRDSRWASIPVIALSADLSPQAAAIDAAVYLTKPLDHGDILKALQGIKQQLLRARSVARATELQRLVSLGTLLGGIAHEINNPLAFMSGSVEVLDRTLAGMSARDEVDAKGLAAALQSAQRVRTGIERIAAVVKSVSLFAFEDSTVLEPLDVHGVLEASLQIASNELRHSAKLERRYADVPHVIANPARLAQVFLNLLLNAVFAIREDGHDGHVVRVESALKGEHVAITISDSAFTLYAGADAEIFDPLFVDGQAGRMGLRFGLAISRELVEAVGGSIEVAPALPRGTSFRVLLPVSRAEVHSASVTPPPPVNSSTRPAVLVVDDEPLVCELLEAMLGVEYDVTAFTSPLDALAALQDGAFDVVVCDVMMPELDGLALYERTAKARPELAERFIFVTGGAFTERARRALPRTKRPILQKPCSHSALVAAIEASLRPELSRRREG